MNNIADSRTTTKLLSAVSLPALLPAVLAVNTFTLLAIDRLGGFPTWIKSAVALFLAF